MLIELSKILSVGDKDIDIQTDIEMQEFVSKMGSYKVIDKKPLNIHLSNAGKKRFLLETDIDITFSIPCGRCLEDVEYRMNIEVRKSFDMNESDDETDEEHFYITEDNEFNVEEFVYNEVLVNMPMKVLCSESCKGICNRCGANLNTQTCNCDTTELDPRMSKIRDIFNNFKEV